MERLAPEDEASALGEGWRATTRTGLLLSTCFMILSSCGQTGFIMLLGVYLAPVCKCLALSLYVFIFKI